MPSTLAPVAAIDGMGFAFKDYRQVWAAMEGDLGKHVRAALAKADPVAMEKCRAIRHPPYHKACRWRMARWFPAQPHASCSGSRIPPSAAATS
jgi:hypothetical protein